MAKKLYNQVIVAKVQLVKYRVRRSWLVLAGLSGLLAGLGLVRIGFAPEPSFIWLVVALSPLILLQRWWSLSFVLLLGLGLGGWRGQLVQTDLLRYETYHFQNIELVGTVQDDPSYHQSGQLEFYVTSLKLDGQSLRGRIRARGFTGALAIRRGDRVKVIGQLYPGFASWQGSVSYAEITVTERDSSPITTLRRNFLAGVYTALPEPQASLGLGFLVGTRALLPVELTEQLRRVGLTHIVAVSGYNLTILVRFARRLGMRFSKRLAVLLAVGLLAVFITMTGVPPSVARATVVAGLALSAWYYGRRVSPVMLLLLSSAVTAYINPLYLWSDLGWWLSFLAFFGILIVAPLVRRKVFGQQKLHWLPAIMIETACAQLMTMPLTMAVFGELSVIALLANVLILPFVPFAMLLTFTAGVVGMIAPVLAGWIAWPARVLLSFMTEVVSLLSYPSWSLAEFKLSTVAAGVTYGLIAVLTVLSYRLLRRRYKVVFDQSVVE